MTTLALAVETAKAMELQAGGHWLLYLPEVVSFLMNEVKACERRLHDTR